MCTECRQHPCNPRCPNNEDKPIGECRFCGCDIYQDEDPWHDLKGNLYCRDCVEKIWEED